MAYPSLLMIHGAANAAWVWDAWRSHLKVLGWEVNVLDLRGHGRSLPVDFSAVTMEDYVNDVESVTSQIAAAQGQHPVMAGWSMGGLIAMMYAAQHLETPALLLFSPTPPLQVAGKGSLEELRKIPLSPIGPEYFGIYPDDIEASRPALFDLTSEETSRVLRNMTDAQESGLARRQADSGISIAPDAIRCPALVIYGDEEKARPPEMNRRTALYLAGDSIGVAGASHWGIVYSQTAVAETAPKVDQWLRRSLKST